MFGDSSCSVTLSGDANCLGRLSLEADKKRGVLEPSLAPCLCLPHRLHFVHPGHVSLVGECFMLTSLWENTSGQGYMATKELV